MEQELLKMAQLAYFYWEMEDEKLMDDTLAMFYDMADEYASENGISSEEGYDPDHFYSKFLDHSEVTKYLEE